MEKILLIILFFIFWFIWNYTVKIFLSNNLTDDFVLSAIKYRKTLMFNILTLIFFMLFDINFLTWIGIVYYIIISILEGVMLVISVITNLDYYIKKKEFETHMWLLVLAKTLNEITHIIMTITLFSMLN